jgi:hypothetical protein
MRRAISWCLIASMLCAGVAWAADRHAEAFFGHGEDWLLRGSLWEGWVDWLAASGQIEAWLVLEPQFSRDDR